jgi:hypothetical protein
VALRLTLQSHQLSPLLQMFQRVNVTYTSTIHGGVFAMSSKPFFNFLASHVLLLCARAMSLAEGFKTLTPLRTVRLLKITRLIFNALGLVDVVRVAFLLAAIVIPGDVVVVR